MTASLVVSRSIAPIMGHQLDFFLFLFIFYLESCERGSSSLPLSLFKLVLASLVQALALLESQETEAFTLINQET